MTHWGNDPSERAEREAMAWFVRLRDPGASDADRRAFSAWLAADPAHREAFAEVEALWKELDAPAAALAAEGHHRKPAIASAPHAPNWRKRAAAFGIAAAVAAAAVLWRDPGIIDRARADHATRPGQRLDVSLGDGTKLVLDGDSAIAESTEGKSREVTVIRGRVWFDVARDASRPFLVHADDLDVRVVGTAFDVDRDGGVVTVERGTVSVAEAGDHFRLSAGQRVTSVSGRLTAPEAANLDASLAWRRGLIVLDAAPLQDVFRAFARMTSGRIVAPQAEVRALKLSGVFRADDPQALIEAMRHGLGLKTFSAPGLATVVYR